MYSYAHRYYSTVGWRPLSRNSILCNICRIYIYIFHAVLQPSSGYGLLVLEFSRSRSDIPQSVGFLWASDQPDAGTSTWQHTQHSQQTDIHAPGGILKRDRQTCMPPAGFEPVTPTSGRPQTHILDRAATGTGIYIYFWSEQVKEK